MKKQLYLAPEAQALSVVMESTFICASSVNSSSPDMSIRDVDGDDFWTY